MIEVTGDLWTYPADVRVITTNGFVKKNGEAVMGAGCALEAAIRWPDLPSQLGDLIRQRGNRVFSIGFPITDGESRAEYQLATFPVKHAWWEKADLALIEKSCQELVALAGMYPHTTVFVLPRPGCGNGKLKWEQVRPVLEKYFDDRFHIIDFPHR